MLKHSKLMIVMMALAIVVILAGTLQLQAEEEVTCIVSGKTIKKSEAKGSHEYKGETYYFCCENCKEAFLKEPEKFIANPGMGHGEHSHEGHKHAKLAEDTAVDPVCNMKVKKSEAKFKHEHNGKAYYFCSEGCLEKFANDPAAYVSADKDAVTCPVSKKTFNKSDANGSMEYKGKTYYFCCSGCRDEFKTNPEKYAKMDEANSGNGQSACACSSGKAKTKKK